MSRLEHIASRALEQGKMELERQIVIAEIERHTVRARKPAGTWAHVLATKAQAKRERSDQPSCRLPLHHAHFRARISREADNGT